MDRDEARVIFHSCQALGLALIFALYNEVITRPSHKKRSLYCRARLNECSNTSTQEPKAL